MDTEEFLIERLILQIGNTINNIRMNDLKESDLTPAQSETILFYDTHPGVSIRELSEYLRVTHQAARKLVAKLKAKGIITTSVSQKDKRYTEVKLTEAGKEVCRELKNRGSHTGEGILKDFSNEDKNALLEYMKRIEKNIKGSES